MSDASRIDLIVDGTAALAAGIEGVKVVWGVGTGLIVVPNDPKAMQNEWMGQLVRTYPGNVTAPGTHVSDMPTAPVVTYKSATVAELTWAIPWRFYVGQGDLAFARVQCAPMYARYLARFAENTQLEVVAVASGISLPLVNSSLLTSFDLFTEGDWVGLRGVWTAIERLNLELHV